MKDRIKELMERQHMQQNVFAEVLNISPGSLSGIFSERTKPSLNIVMAIKEKFPKVNLDWLLYGRGAMFLDDNGSKNMNGSSVLGAGNSSVNASSAGGAGSPVQSPTLFSSPGVNTNGNGVNATPKNGQVEIIKYLDKPQRKITEIRIFYDDQTWETFVPKK